MIFVGIALALVGFVLGKYTINPSFPDGAYSGMTRHTWRILGGVLVAAGAACVIFGLVSLR